MAKGKRLFIGFGKMYPKGYAASVDRLTKYSGSKDSGASWLGKMLVATMLYVAIANAALFLLGLLQDPLIMPVINAAGIVIIQVAAYILPYYAGERRAKAAENSLASFYQLLSSYLRSGMTPFQALKASSKKEFGVLKEEIDYATSRAFGTQSFSDALLGISTRIHSDSLKRSTELMVRGIDNGGSLAKLLEESASNLIESKELRKQIIAASRTYMLMVVFAVVVGAPLLLSISTRFNERMMELSTNIEASAGGVQGLQTGLFVGGSSINPEFLLNMSIVTIFMTALISSFLVGIIAEGKEKYGIKYAVIFVPLSLLFFFLFRFLLTTVL